MRASQERLLATDADDDLEPCEADVHDVIIVGAGVAGLACARTMIDAGARVLLLEGSERVWFKNWSTCARKKFFKALSRLSPVSVRPIWLELLVN